jgi:CheY-like chemotaxis protein
MTEAKASLEKNTKQTKLTKKDLSVLFIDDESITAKNFKKLFDKEFNIITTTDPDEALEICLKQNIAVIISDQRMPNRTGTNLLTQVKEKTPNIVRILTTAYATLEDNIEAINKSNVFAYITKPWNLDELRSLINKCLEKFLSDQSHINFGNFIAHEMRNPLNLVVQSTNFIKEKLLLTMLEERLCCSQPEVSIIPFKKKDIDEILDSIDVTNSSAKKGDILIDMILNSIKKKSPCEDYILEMKISEAIDSAIREYAFLKKEKNLVTVEITDDFAVNVNKITLSYIFFNLLKNSLYYSNSKNNFHIIINAKAGKDGFNYVYFRDNGPGIEKEKISRMFDDFYTDGKQGGTGIGLSFCKKTMDDFSGEIYCNSKKGKFTEFVLKFPIVNRDSNQKNQPAENKILIVDDEKVNVFIVAKTLKNNLKNVDFDVAKNGLLAVSLAKKNKYNAILMDIKMPKMDGISATTEIRKLDKTTPIICYSSDSISARSLRSSGFNDFVQKKSSLNFFTRTVAKWSSIEMGYGLIAPDEIKNILQNKKFLIADDEEMSLLITKQYFSKFSNEIDAAKNGSEAFKLAALGNYDIILMDLEMNKLDGISAIKEMRDIGIKCLAVALTGHSERALEILNSGFNDYFIKGKSYDNLAELIAIQLL